MDPVEMESVPTAPAAPSLVGAEPAPSIAVAGVQLQVPALLQVEEHAEMDPVVMVPALTALVVPSLVGVEPAPSIVVVGVQLQVPVQHQVQVALEDLLEC